MSHRHTVLAALGSVAVVTSTTLAAGTPGAVATPRVASVTTAATATCSTTGKTFKKVNTRDVPARAAHTARRLQADAKDCNKRSLVWRATKDKTHLSYGVISPQRAFALPDRAERRYWYLAKALSLRPGTEKIGRTSYKVWPRVATTWHAKKASAWQELVTSGMYTQKQVNEMRRSGIGYTGWRVGISHGGRWVYDIAGD